MIKINEEDTVDKVAHIRAVAARLKAEKPSVRIVDNFDDPVDPYMEIHGLAEKELTQAERDLRQHPVHIRRSDGTELLTLLMVSEPILSTRWPGTGFEIDQDPDGTYAIVIP